MFRLITELWFEYSHSIFYQEGTLGFLGPHFIIQSYTRRNHFSNNSYYVYI